MGQMKPTPRKRTARKKPRHKWVGGERVVRPVYLDDGTWMTHGDKCLPNSPLKHGRVIRRLDDVCGGLVLVRWDDGKEERFLDHGIDPELTNNAKPAVIPV